MVPPSNPIAPTTAVTHHRSPGGCVMRVFVVVALAAAMAGCSTVQPQQPILPAVKAPPTIAPPTNAVMKERPRHHNRAGRSSKVEASAPKASLQSSGVDAKAIAETIKAIVAAKLGNPASIQFQDIVPGNAAGSFCGVAQVKGTSGEAREMPFVVQRGRVSIINGSDDRQAAAAIHAMCDR
jgi:hypothetical protein